jgi:hypothetical protein
VGTTTVMDMSMSMSMHTQMDMRSVTGMLME